MIFKGEGQQQVGRIWEEHLGRSFINGFGWTGILSNEDLENPSDENDTVSADAVFAFNDPIEKKANAVYVSAKRRQDFNSIKSSIRKWAQKTIDNINLLDVEKHLKRIRTAMEISESNTYLAENGILAIHTPGMTKNQRNELRSQISLLDLPRSRSIKMFLLYTTYDSLCFQGIRQKLAELKGRRNYSNISLYYPGIGPARVINCYKITAPYLIFRANFENTNHDYILFYFDEVLPESIKLLANNIKIFLGDGLTDAQRLELYSPNYGIDDHDLQNILRSNFVTIIKNTNFEIREVTAQPMSLPNQLEWPYDER